jgi:hypothetical protein
MATTSGGKRAACQARQENGYANLCVHRGPEDTVGLNFLLLLGPEGIGEIVVQCRVFCVQFLRSEKKLQAAALYHRQVSTEMQERNEFNFNGSILPPQHMRLQLTVLGCHWMTSMQECSTRLHQAAQVPQ